MVTFTESSAFVPGATYRVLRLGDGKIGLYQLLQHGARLDSEFFPESMDRRSWPSTTEYLRFLDSRHVEFVMLWSTFDDAFHTNEHRLLDDLAGQPNTDRRVRLVGQTHDYDLYAVDPARPRAALTTAGG
jgi:hypothetical protein